MAAKKRVLITGTQGLIGWNLYKFLPRKRYQVFAFSKNRQPNSPNWYQGLLEDPPGLSRIITDARPDIIIHAHAVCNLDVCEVTPEKTHAINVRGTRVLLDAYDPDRHTFIYLSSEHVFSGKQGNYKEDDACDPGYTEDIEHIGA